MLSWIVFWMEKDDIGNRMALGITTILTIMFLLGSLNGNLPKVSYPKALDWYLLVSFSFVFLSLIECMIVYLFVAEAKQDKQKPIKVMVNGLILARKMTRLYQDCTHADDIIFHPLTKPLGSNLFLLTCLNIFVFYVFICLFTYFLFGGSLAERLGRWGPFLESPDK